jgi:hypothetical protein
MLGGDNVAKHNYHQWMTFFIPFHDVFILFIFFE